MKHNIALLQDVRAALIEQRDASKTFTERLASLAAVEAIEKMIAEQEPSKPEWIAPEPEPEPEPAQDEYGFGMDQPATPDLPTAIAAAVMAMPWAMTKDMDVADRRFGMIQEAAEVIFDEYNVMPAQATKPLPPGYLAYQTFWQDRSDHCDIWEIMTDETKARWARIEALMVTTNQG